MMNDIISTLPEHDGTIVYLDDGLFLSSAAPARNAIVLQHLEITHVLNCTGYVKGSTEELRFPPTNNDGVLFADILTGGYKQIIIADENDITYDEFMNTIINPSKEFMDSVLLVNGTTSNEQKEEELEKALPTQRLVVHCEAGISRSSSIVIAHIMRSRNMHLLNAYNYVKSKKNNIDPNNKFLEHLLTYENSLMNENILDDNNGMPSMNLRHHYAVKINNDFFGGSKDIVDIENALQSHDDDPGKATTFLFTE